MGISLTPNEIERCFNDFKNLCDKKKETNDRDIEALVFNIIPETAQTKYSLKGFSVHTGDSEVATAVISLEKDGELKSEVAMGNGPVDAAYKAVDKIVNPPEYVFENYVIQSVSQGKDTLGEVMTTLRYGDRTFSARGISTDVIEASILSYIHTLSKLMDYTQVSGSLGEKIEAMA